MPGRLCVGLVDAGDRARGGSPSSSSSGGRRATSTTAQTSRPIGQRRAAGTRRQVVEKGNDRGNWLRHFAGERPDPRIDVRLSRL